MSTQIKCDETSCRLQAHISCIAERKPSLCKQLKHTHTYTHTHLSICISYRKKAPSRCLKQKRVNLLCFTYKTYLCIIYLPMKLPIKDKLVPVYSKRRSAKVLFPWSTWAIMLKFLILSCINSAISNVACKKRYIRVIVKFCSTNRLFTYIYIP